MTYKLPEPMISIVGLKLDIYTRLYVQEIADAAYAAGQRDMLALCVEVLTRYNDCSDAYEEMKELLNEDLHSSAV